MSDVLMSTYNKLPVEFSHGKGIWLWDKSDKKYLDALGGLAVCGLGHAHPAVTAAICEQAAKLIHVSNAFHIPQQYQLGEKLTRLSGMDKVFYCNSGAEANEAALKMARLFGHSKDIDNPAIIVMEGSFHGRTLATLSASGSRKNQAGYEPLVQGFIRAPFNDLQALESIAKNNHNVVAVLLEPIQGEGGIIVPDKNYLTEIRRICDEHDWLMILDEVQTGIGRTGKMFAYQHSNILPDIVSIAKSLANGIPIGACLARGKASQLFTPGKHGSTFGGNPLACHTAYTVLQTIEHEQLAENAAKMGSYLLAGLQENLRNQPLVKAIRGQGLMLGIEMTTPCRELLQIGLAKGLLFNVTQEKVIRLLPPLIIQRAEADQLIELLTACITEYQQ